MRKRTILAAAAAALTALAGATAAAAHHSYAMFDRAKTMTISGTVLTWEMVSPHSFLWVIVKKDDGGQANWGLESGGVGVLVRSGVTKSMIKSGEKIEATLHPLRDGRTGGQLISVKLADGRTIRMGGGGGGEGVR